jgi:hypothetical protein
MKISTKKLSLDRWTDLEKLGPGLWRRFGGSRWEAMLRFREALEAGTVSGVVAYLAGRPVGLCTFGGTAPVFYVKASARKQGAAKALVRATLGGMAKAPAPIRLRLPPPEVPSLCSTGTEPQFARSTRMRLVIG